MKGIGVSPGIAIGRAYWLRQREARVSGIVLADAVAVEAEKVKYRGAVVAAIGELEAMMATAGKEEAAILEVQVELLRDPAWEEEVFRRIGEHLMPARDAVLLTIAPFVEMFEKMEDDYLRARAADIKDIGWRLFRQLAGFPAGRHLPDGKGWIVVAEDLTPSDMIGLDAGRVEGFITQAGGKTSHTAIVARLRGLPAVVAMGKALVAVADGDELVLDGESGVVLVNPPAKVLAKYRRKRNEFLRRRQMLESLKDRVAVTRDGVRVHLEANIASVEDMEQALSYGAEGVGLLRTELLFMERDQLPTEEEQFTFYKNVLLRSGGRPVTIRTLDIGGDKPLPYLGLPKEENPFLGYRAIRICLDRRDLFLTQLRAILRAGVFGSCRIMFPMIGSVEELRVAKAVVAEARETLTVEGVDFAADIPVGVMIEIPSAALTADLLAKEADFFSIGTNDLCQYTLAVDRMNEKIAALYDPFHPAVLRLIRMTIEEGQRAGIPVGMCGELAGDVAATKLLFDMGLREFSMAAASIPEVKAIILGL
ncbi:phosphoenolpyruvate--protein phosphotransferase [Puia dinghuensis]|uniref:Phosphoenolpyruvate-protein phosphotransferase n=1 Tax=Puia dinghuensis TaxID=1792502 RepID=A0A8J2XRT3_9BACT|nr:phosphoenolpyruvate--protein phosphotransferase [Puia dinghuensis]GGB04060.1 phosphoenolpyruvate-protein phosphotransferase [Puia dinghuensis]